MEVDSPDVVIAKELLDQAKLGGFAFRRVAPGADGLIGKREGGDWVDVLHIAGAIHIPVSAFAILVLFFGIDAIAALLWGRRGGIEARGLSLDAVAPVTITA